MRSTFRLALLALLAVFALSAVTAATASAVLPEFKPVPTKKKFTSTSGLVTFRVVNRVIECTKSSASGEITGGRTVGNVNMVLTGCKITAEGTVYCPIDSVGAGPEEIVMKTVSGELGTVKTTEAPSGVALLLKPETGKFWTELESTSCIGGTRVAGSIGGEIAIIGKKQATNKVVIAPKTIRHIQLDSGILEEPELVMWSVQAAVTATDELKFEEAVEVT